MSRRPAPNQTALFDAYSRPLTPATREQIALRMDTGHIQPQDPDDGIIADIVYKTSGKGVTPLNAHQISVEAGVALEAAQNSLRRLQRDEQVFEWPPLTEGGTWPVYKSVPRECIA